MDGLILLNQEFSGDSKFNKAMHCTNAFITKFGPKAFLIAAKAVDMIQKQRVNSPDGADSFQVLTFEGTKFYCIEDQVVTCLLPQDY